MRYRTMLGTLCVLTLIGCSDIFEADGPEISVGLAAPGPFFRGANLRVDIGEQVVQLTQPTDARPSTSTEVRGPRYGEVPIGVTLLGANGDTLGATEYTQLFSKNYEHFIHATVTTRRPEGHCIGTLIVVPLRERTDTLFVTHGAVAKNSIC